MLARKYIAQWSLLIMILFANVAHHSYAQEIETAEHIMTNFQKSLHQARAGQDTLKVYEEYFVRLVNRGNFIHADSIIQQGESGINQIQDSSKLVNFYKARAHMYRVQRRFEKSLEDYLWLEAYFQGIDSKQDLIEIYTLLAEYYRSITQKDLFEKHLKMAEDLFSEVTPTDENMAYWHSRKAAWYNEGNTIRDSLVYHALAGLKLAHSDRASYTRALLFNELGFNAASINLGRDSVLSYYNESKEILFGTERYRDYVDIMNNIGIYEYRQGSIQESIRILESIIPIAEENQWYSPLEFTYHRLTYAYKSLGLYEKSLEMNIESRNKAIFNLRSIHEIELNDLALNYEKGLAEKELEIQEQKTAVAQSEAADNRRKFIISLVAVIVLLILVIVAMKISFRFRKKNEQLRLQQEKINEINHELERSLKQQTTLFKELNHRVKNNLSILTGLVFFQEEEESDSRFKETLATLQNRIRTMAFAHESLYHSEENKDIDFHHYLKELFDDLRSSMVGSEGINTFVECKGLVLSLQQATPLAMIMNELFTNSIKHGFMGLTEGKIEIIASREDKFWYIEYTDNGRGFSNKKSSKGALGTKLIELLLEQIDATMESNPAEIGVNFLIRLPIKDDTSIRQMDQDFMAQNV